MVDTVSGAETARDVDTMSGAGTAREDCVANRVKAVDEVADDAKAFFWCPTGLFSARD